MSPIEDFEQVIAELERADKFLLTTHQNPDGDALGSLIGMHELLTRLGKDSVMFLAADQFPLPARVPAHGARRVVSTPPEDVGERVAVFLDCGNINRMPVDFLLRGGRPHRQHRPPSRQHALRHREPRDAERVVRRRDRLPARERDERRGVGHDGRGPLHRGHHRHRPLHVREHHRRVAPDGGRPGARRRAAARDLPPGVRGDPGAAAAAARAAPSRGSSATTTDCSRSRTSGSRTSSRRAPTSRTRRASSTTSAASRAPRWARWSEPGCRTGTPDSHKVSLRATDDRVDVSVIARGFGGGGTPAGGGLLHRPPGARARGADPGGDRRPARGGGEAVRWASGPRIPLASSCIRSPRA